MTYAEFREETKGKRIANRTTNKILSRIQSYFNFSIERLDHIILGNDSEYRYEDHKDWIDGEYNDPDRRKAERFKLN